MAVVIDARSPAAISPGRRGADGVGGGYSRPSRIEDIDQRTGEVHRLDIGRRFLLRLCLCRPLPIIAGIGKSAC